MDIESQWKEFFHHALFSDNKVAQLVRFDMVEISQAIALYVIKKENQCKIQELVEQTKQK